MPAPGARKAAHAAGLTRYRGNPCWRCGCVDRYTSGGQCVACNGERASDSYSPHYAREHYHRNIETMRARNRNKERKRRLDMQRDNFIGSIDAATTE